jgi:hypothetical protein
VAVHLVKHRPWNLRHPSPANNDDDDDCHDHNEGLTISETTWVTILTFYSPRLLTFHDSFDRALLRIAARF